MSYKYSDIALTEDGDLAIGPSGDFYLSKSTSALQQGIDFRLMTDLNDMFLHPKLGTNIRELVGRRNTKELLESGKASIISCLTYNNFIDASDLTVVGIPVDATTILYHVEISNDTYVAYKFDLMCDLENGIRKV
jgi:hypothetical protein